MKLRLISVILWGWIATTLTHAMNHSFEQGSSWVQNRPIPNPQNPQLVPGYGGKDLPQSSIKAHDLGGAAQQSSQSNEASKVVVDTFGSRQKYTIDSQKDPLMVSANQVLADPQKTLNETMTEVSGSLIPSEEIKTCEEGGDEYFQNCSKKLEIVFQITPATTQNIRHCPGHEKKKRVRLHFKHWTEHCNPGCTTKAIPVAEKAEKIREEWVDGCAVLESHVEQGLCRYVSASRSPQNETRSIQGQSVTRDHFEEHYRYGCFKTSPNTCKALREKGCYQINSVCKEKMENTCILWEQTFRCPSGKKSGQSYRSSNKESPFCLGGDCTDASYDTNKDFGQVMSQMSVLKEAQEDLRKFATIFRGRDRRCTRNCLDFRDCCGSFKGWGVSFNLSKCDADEKELRELRDLNRCVMVGTYCAEKLLGQCIRKKTTFCCYDSKLAKIIQEQGKGQLGLGFGSPEHPQCQGLSAEQLSSIDFSKVNFSDFLRDIASSTKVPDPQKITQSIQASMKDKTSHLTTPPQSSTQLLKTQGKTQGRNHGDF